jgi:hypothetical protein
LGPIIVLAIAAAVVGMIGTIGGSRLAGLAVLIAAADCAIFFALVHYFFTHLPVC